MSKGKLLEFISRPEMAMSKLKKVLERDIARENQARMIPGIMKEPIPLPPTQTAYGDTIEGIFEGIGDSTKQGFLTRFYGGKDGNFDKFVSGKTYDDVFLPQKDELAALYNKALGITDAEQQVLKKPGTSFEVKDPDSLAVIQALDALRTRPQVFFEDGSVI